MVHAKYSWASEAMLLRYVTQFGTQTWDLMEGINSVEDLGHCFSEQANGVYQREIDYLMNHEMAINEEDILWRRTKLGLYMNQEEQQALTDYLKEKLQQKVVNLSQVS